MSKLTKSITTGLTALALATALFSGTSYAAGDRGMGHMGRMDRMSDHGGRGFGRGEGFGGIGMALIAERVIWSATASSNGHTETATGYDDGQDFTKPKGKRQKVRVVRTKDGKPVTKGPSWASSTDPATGITTTSTSNGDGSRTVTQVNAQGATISSQVVH